MSDQSPTDVPQRPRSKSIGRRLVAALLIAFVGFVVLWYTVYSAVTAAIVASGGAVVLLAGSSVSETFQSIFDVIAEFVLGIFGAIADFFTSLFD